MHRFEKTEKYFESHQEIPGTLDLVQIDGRWAQVVGGIIDASSVNEETEMGVVWLDTKEGDRVRYADLELVEVHRLQLRHFESFKSGDFPEELIDQIYYDSQTQDLPDDEERKEIKKTVKVFGTYRTKKKQPSSE